MTDYDYSRTWYHGSQQRLNTLRVGSSITQNKDVAKTFSHRPSIVTMSDGGEGESHADVWKVRHNGVEPGYLDVVVDETEPDDVRPHPHPVNVARWEWLTNRDLRLQLIKETAVSDREKLPDIEVAAVRRKQREKGELSFVESSDK